MKKERFSYKDYYGWDDGKRWELIDGLAYDMCAAPNRRHQEILVNLSTEFHGFLKNKKCKVYPAPFDVRLPDESKRDEDIYNVVQPDISIICDKNKLDDRGCIGAPDLIVEILSPSTMLKDIKEKSNLYEKYGVKEYWIIHPSDGSVSVYLLGKAGKFMEPVIYLENKKINSKVLRGFKIELKTIFE